jgi:ABC-type branched-subunit amino acid transport system substrate-binding protein
MLKKIALLHFYLALLSVYYIEAKAQEFKHSIYVGQVSPLTGPAASIGIPLTQGAALVARKVNKQGGINGGKLVLIDKDDAFDPKRTIEHVQSLLAEKSKPVVALINVVGSPNSGDLVSQGILKTNDLSLVGAFTGSTSVREMKSPHVYFIRPGVEGEAEHIVNHFVTLGLERIALVHPEDTFGRDALAQMTKALKARKLDLAGVGTYAPATTDVSRAVSVMIEKSPQAIAIFATGAASAKFIASFRERGGGAMLTTSSSTSGDHLIKALAKEQSRGVGVLQVVPPLYKVAVPLVKEYLQALQQHGEPGWTPSAYGLEGYATAKVLVTALSRVQGAPTASNVSQAMSRLGVVDLGGMSLDFSKGRLEGAQRVEIGVIASEGRLRN